MNNFLKIFSRKKILFILLFFSYQLFALDDFQVQNEKPSADSLINKITVPKDSTSGIKRTAGFIPLQIPSLLDKNFNTSIISKKTLETTDYRTTADFFTNIPFGFVRDLGSVGQPNEALIYGLGFGNISFLSDGIPINNRLSNALDLNLFQSESIDSIEVIPLSRGFLYGGMNNPVSVNFISRQPEIRKPYSRLKYYQAPNSEGMIDGIFNISPFKRLNAFFEITNQGTNPYFINTDHSNWMGSVRLRYLLSNNINIIAGYKYVQTNTQLFGGIDADSINRAYPASQFETILYDNFRAPVRFSNRYQKVTGHNFSLRMLGNFIEHSPTDISLYYQTNLTEFRQNEPSDQSKYKPNFESIIHDNKFATFGGQLTQNFNAGLSSIQSITSYEQTTLSTPLLPVERITNSFSSSAKISFGLRKGDVFLIPSLFGKYLNYNGRNYFGIGFDATLSLNNSFQIYVGLSKYKKPGHVFSEYSLAPDAFYGEQTNEFIEGKINYKNSILNLSAGYFYLNFTPNHNLLISDLNLQGLNIQLEVRLWKLSLNSNSSYYFNEAARFGYKIPEFTSYGGIYYVDTLFNNNLKLKAGLSYSSIGSRNNIYIDFEKSVYSSYIYWPTTQDVRPDLFVQAAPSFQLDFFLAGKIQNLATVYFVFENLLDTKYFIVPYYPKQARGIRFGVAWEFLD